EYYPIHNEPGRGSHAFYFSLNERAVTKNMVNYEIFCSFSIIGNDPVLGRRRLFTECEDVFGYGKYDGK
ncbi:hypothetical protein, partial [Phocaeicola sartorii]|uniref:hypothetical protein n=1 Tax=Phocaeicola sartorii TaxID=671267 RepID=UPI0021AA6385